VSVPAGLTRQADVSAGLDVTCDVVVVGSGAGGATMAAGLADAGVDVVMVEEGGYHPTESFTAGAGHALRTLYRDCGAQIAMGHPPVLFSEGRCVGGSTVVNGGMSWRTPPKVLERWARDGVADIGEREMEPHFVKVESRISVAFQDPETVGEDMRLLKAGADAKGWKIIPNLRNQLHCAGTNNCTNGCPTGAKRSMLVTNVPRALARGARLFADCRVDRIIRSDGRVTGVSGHFVRPGGRRGPELTVRSAVVVVADGAVRTPALLARSGFRSRSGQLGRNLTLHPNAKVIAFFDHDVTGWHGVHQAFQIREFMDEGILLTAVNLAPSLLALGMPAHAYGSELGELMAGYNRIVTAGCLIEDTGTGRVRIIPGLGPQVFYQITDSDAARVVRGAALAAEATFACVLPDRAVPAAHRRRRRGAGQASRPEGLVESNPPDLAGYSPLSQVSPQKAARRNLTDITRRYSTGRYGPGDRPTPSAHGRESSWPPHDDSRSASRDRAPPFVLVSGGAIERVRWGGGVHYTGSTRVVGCWCWGLIRRRPRLARRCTTVPGSWARP
jgi:choline dehydrogenase-like flavoprotein